MSKAPMNDGEKPFADHITKMWATKIFAYAADEPFVTYSVMSIDELWLP